MEPTIIDDDAAIIAALTPEQLERTRLDILTALHDLNLTDWQRGNNRNLLQVVVDEQARRRIA